MIQLLDVNVLIALGDADHTHRVKAIRFFEQSAAVEGWATCPLTENAFIRILGGHAYPGGPGSTMEARRLLASILRAPGHQFWPDDLSLADVRAFPALPGSKALTDHYLLALAVKHRGRFVTFDHRIDASLIPGGPAAYFTIPAS